MPRSKAALIVTIIYVICVTAAIVANQHGSDIEGVIVWQILLGMPWALLLVILRINAWYGPYLYAISIAFNAATLYLIAAWVATVKKKGQSSPLQKAE